MNHFMISGIFNIFIKEQLYLKIINAEIYLVFAKHLLLTLFQVLRRLIFDAQKHHSPMQTFIWIKSIGSPRRVNWENTDVNVNPIWR